jgi:recombination protein RecT
MTETKLVAKQASPMESFRSSITNMQDQIKMALPTHIPVERFTRTLFTAIQQNPSLLEADRQSLFGAVMQAAQQGLLPDSREGAIITFKMKDGTQKATWLPMIAGILKKIRNSGEVSTITAQIIHKTDLFKYWVDEDGEHVKHEPDFFEEDKGEPVGVYAMAKTKDGDFFIEVLNKTEVNAVKNMSRSKDAGPWGGPFYLEMWKKTAIRRLAKRLPMSSDLDDFIRQDDHLIEMKPTVVTPEETKQSRVSQLIEKTTPSESGEG